ncbi:MAG: hypothetical protein H6553_12655 [Chitinophagales bacterium]|nr:hypothetical protein [Chitinophagales bacterium]
MFLISERNQKIIVISLTVIFIGLFFFLSEKEHNKLDKERKENAKYTIGITKGVDWVYKSSAVHIKYEYKIFIDTYTATDVKPSKLKVKKKGGYYIVEFSKKNRQNSKMLFDLGEIPPKKVKELFEYSIGFWDTIPAW